MDTKKHYTIADIRKFIRIHRCSVKNGESPYDVCARILRKQGHHSAHTISRHVCTDLQNVILGVVHGIPANVAEPSHKFAMSDEFLSTYEWRRVRMMALKKYGARCQCCGASPADGAVMNVDHIKPRRLFPQLALDVNNLQVLCHECNHGKGNWDMTDWRDAHHADRLGPEEQAHIRDILSGL